MSQDNQLNYTVKGTISEIKDTAHAGNFKKREFCLKVDDGKYPQEIKLEVVQQKVDTLDNFEVDDKVEVQFNLRGNRSKAGSVYNNLTAWKITPLGSGGRPKPRQNAPSDWRPGARQDEDEINF